MTYVPTSTVTVSGTVDVSTSVFIPGDEIRRGHVSGATGWTKFGYRYDLQQASGEQMIWSTSGNWTPVTSAGTFNIHYNQAVDGAGTSGARKIGVWYVNSSGTPTYTAHTLGNTGVDTTSFSGFGINRMAVTSNGGDRYNVSAIETVMTSASTIQAHMPEKGSVTQQALYHVGGAHIAIGKFLYFNVNKLAGSNPKVLVKAYVYSRAVDTIYEVFRHTIDTQSENTVIIEEPVGFNLSPTDSLYWVADTDQNNTLITLRFSLIEYAN